MVAISLSGSGEGLGRAIARGYSTGNDGKKAVDVIPAKAGIHGFSDQCSPQTRKPNTDARVRRSPTLESLDADKPVEPGPMEFHRSWCIIERSQGTGSGRR